MAAMTGPRRNSTIFLSPPRVTAVIPTLKIAEVPSQDERIHGVSNLNAWKDGKRVLKTILRERVRRLAEPNDDWQPQYDEVGNSGIDVADLGRARASGLSPQ
jgi:hypothetical protein